MIEKQNRTNLFAKALTFALLALMLLEMLLPLFTLNVSAEGTTTTYSNVLDDLKKDETFNPEDYPAKADDYSLQVIQVAEGSNGELFVYVYQPGADTVDVKASSINISTVLRGKDKFYNYPLTYLNSNGVFYKYKVENFVVSVETQRCYEIPSIFRIAVGDETNAGGDNTVSEVSYPVGRRYTMTSQEDGSVSIKLEDIEYITVTDKYVGFIRYVNTEVSFGLNLTSKCDAHFVSFNTDRKIDELLEADIYFKQQSYTKIQSPNTSGTSYNTKEYWSDPEEKYVYMDFESKGIAIYENNFVEHEKIFYRIQKTSEFTAQEYETGIFQFSGFNNNEQIKFTDEAYEALKGTSWTLCFIETDSYTEIKTLGGTITQVQSKVGDVSLLRLKFITNGVVYDLGVVDNKQTGSDDPSAIVGGEFSLEEAFKKLFQILMLFIVICVLIFLGPYIKILVEILWSAIKILATVLAKIVSFPFNVLGALFKRE